MIAQIRRLLARETVWAALVLVLILNILFFPCIWGHKSLLDSSQASASILRTGAWAGQRVDMTWSKTLDAAAAAWFFEPSLALTGYEYTKERTIPLWNPYQAYGTPFAADMQAQPFYPLTFLVSLHLTPRTYNLYLLARLFIVGFFAYLYLRLFVSFLGALGGGIAAMLGGYYILYITMPHLSVEILIPAALFTAERLLRDRSYPSFLAFTAILFLAILGGMPESSLLLFVLLYAYIVFRILVDRELRRIWIPLTLRISLASAAGLCLSSILLLPFLEFMRHCYDAHQPKNIAGAIPGLYAYAPDSTVLTYLFALLYGPYNGLANEFGLVAFFLVLVAIFATFSRAAGPEDRRLRCVTWFFFTSSVLFVLKRYGIAINNIGRLPLFRYVDFYKYEEALTSICVAVLCGIGLERLIRKQASRAVLEIALGISLAMAPLAAIIGRDRIAPELKVRHMAVLPGLALGVAVSALLCVAICLIVFRQNTFRLSVSIVAVLAVELSFNYIAPLYYLIDNLPNQSNNAYAGAPYISFLKAKSSYLDRIFARGAFFYPNWPSAFEIQDIRDLDAMFYWKYLPFVRNFITPRPASQTQELWNRFTGWDTDYAFTTPLERRLLQLSSVKYLVSPDSYVDVPFKKVYDAEVKVYEYDDVLPRAALYHHAEIVQNEAEALRALADPDFDPFQTVVLNRENLDRPQRAQIEQINLAAAKKVQAATITSYQSQNVEIRAMLDQSAILVLNDTGYPGWTVTIDGARASWLNANYLFRGVLLSPGKHLVRFTYRPKTFYEGAIIAALAAIALAVPAALRFRAVMFLVNRVSGGTLRDAKTLAPQRSIRHNRQ